jgi:hypothetical protein
LEPWLGALAAVTEQDYDSVIRIPGERVQWPAWMYFRRFQTVKDLILAYRADTTGSPGKIQMRRRAGDAMLAALGDSGNAIDLQRVRAYAEQLCRPQDLRDENGHALDRHVGEELRDPRVWVGHELKRCVLPSVMALIKPLEFFGKVVQRHDRAFVMIKIRPSVRTLKSVLDRWGAAALWNPAALAVWQSLEENAARDIVSAMEDRKVYREGRPTVDATTLADEVERRRLMNAHAFGHRGSLERAVNEIAAEKHASEATVRTWLLRARRERSARARGPVGRRT